MADQVIRLAADENFDHRILKGLRGRHPDLDLVLVRDVPGVAQEEDDVVLEWAASEGRVVLTHDAQTLPAFAELRLAAGLPMPGVVLVHRPCNIGQAIADLEILAYCSLPEEWEGRCVYLPYPS